MPKQKKPNRRAVLMKDGRRVYLYLPDAMINQLRTVGCGSVSAGVRRVFEAFKDHEAPKSLS